MKSNDKKALAVVLLLAAFACYYFLFPSRNWSGQPYLETTQDNGFAVVELFTSEGCSSCPPADELLAKVRKESNGKPVYFLAFHIDYWDRLGWADRFSSVHASERQQQYADWMNKQVLYTPQFVINGKTEFGGDDARRLYSTISDGLQANAKSTLTLRSTENDGQIDVTYTTNTTDKNSSLFLAVVQKNDSTHVKRGENGGRLLHHAQIVRETKVVPIKQNQGKVTLAKPKNYNSTQWEIIGFIQDNQTGVIHAAAKPNN